MSEEKYNEECGLSFEEWELERVVDRINEVGTLEGIGILRKFIQENKAANIYISRAVKRIIIPKGETSVDICIGDEIITVEAAAPSPTTKTME